MKNYLEQVQGLNPEKKRQVLAGTTAVLMVVVLYVWLGYFNNILTTTSDQASLNDQAGTLTAQAAASSDPGFFDRMARGTTYIYGAVTNGLASFGAALNGPREYTIQPK